MGYVGKKYSKNALNCYESEIYPLSYWSKDEILSHYSDEFISQFELTNKTKKVLQYCLLSYDSWHHTGSYYNQTDFYKLASEEELKEEFTPEEFINFLDLAKIETAKKKAVKKECTVEKVYVEYEENISSYRNYPNFKKFKAYGVKKGNWIYTLRGKKKADGSHVFKVETLKRAPAGTAEEFQRIRREYKL